MMILKELKPRKALNKAFLKVKPNRTEIESFKANLIALLERTNDTESEEFHKNLVSDFLKDTYYKQNHFINTKGRNDLVIHNGQNVNSTVGLILEAKKPTNKAEMITTKKLNAKAFQELVLYYLRERITHKNLEVKHLVVTNINEWFIFDATLFDRLFAQNKNLVKQFNDFEGGRLADTKTDFFYRQIAEPFIDQILAPLPEGGVGGGIEFTYFNFNEYYSPRFKSWAKDDVSLIALFKILSPEHLLKLPFTNDSNSLDKRFYSELLHIIGLTETKAGSKKLIGRNKQGERNTGSILEDAIIQLESLDKLSRLEKPNQFGNTQQERLFNVALELSITWINRILFLKLLEAQLITYHKSPLLRGAGGVSVYKFLNLDKVKNYDDLNSLFFQVLARKHDERNEDVKKIFEKVPYLNSSLFEPTDIEQATLFISNLKDDKTIPVFSQTVLKDQQGKKRTGNLSTLQYLFEFLDAYDFGAEGGEEIQEDNKTLINASVLGLIFEKINGYKDGSFFTPGFITMYMCRETIRKAVVQKFNEAATPLSRGAGGVSRREIIPYNPALKELATKLRNNSTKSEIILWKALKGKFEGKYDFHRQKPLDNFIADFFCYELKLVIEIDGESHNWEETQLKDYEKESRFNELGLNVLRFQDTLIFNHLETTLENIKQYVIGFEKGDFSELKYEDSPLNPLTGNVAIINTPLNPLSRGDFKSLDDVYEQIGEGRIFTRQQANEIINSLKICDPAVGSGHFLVSALNEMIAVKNDLKILEDKEGKSLHRYEIEVVNDELIVTDENGELFEYHPGNKESQRIQETLFHEKQTIIENCLFGVDINSNSVKICRLRLWIELLKNAYYKNAGFDSAQPALETLPNIDINIKCGNSLVSRFAIDADLKQALLRSKWSIESYRVAVATYRRAENKEQKRELERLILAIKQSFSGEISMNDPLKKRLDKLANELYHRFTGTFLFEPETPYGKGAKELETKRIEEQEKLEKEIEEITQKIEAKKTNKIFENSFEWRFEFPEVLNDDGDFVGFDVVIGNPPYMRVQEIQASQPNQKLFYESQFQNAKASYDLANIFFELGVNISGKNSNNAYIFPHKFFNAASSEVFRKYLKQGQYIDEIAHFGANMIFEDADTYTCVAQFSKKSSQGFYFQRFPFKSDFKLLMLEKCQYTFITYEMIEKASLLYGSNQWVLFDDKGGFKVFEKIYKQSARIASKFDRVSQGIATGKDEIYLFEGIEEGLYIKGNFVKDKQQRLIEKGILKPFLKGKDVQRYTSPTKSLYVLFPFELNEFGKASIMSEQEIFQKYPNAYKWLKITEDIHRKKDNKSTNDEFWYRYARNQGVDSVEQPKLSSMEICANQPNVIFDKENFYHPTTVYSWVKKQETKESYEFFLAIANSKLLWWFLKITGDTLQGDARRFKTNYLNPFPLPEKVSKEMEKNISDLVKEVFLIKKQNPSTNTTDIENQIDQLVYQLYELTEEEIKIVEGR
jgi:very-short-patch-repair endonuclease